MKETNFTCPHAFILNTYKRPVGLLTASISILPGTKEQKMSSRDHCPYSPSFVIFILIFFVDLESITIYDWLNQMLEPIRICVTYLIKSGEEA